MTYYSALHYAAKAEKSAIAAEESAAKASQASGEIVQLGFDGSMEDGRLVFKHAPSGVEIPYDLLNNYEYEIDMAFPSPGILSDDLQVVVRNGSDTINFVSSLHRSSTESMKIVDMKQVMRYDADRGYRWLFKASYKITPAGYKVFLLYPVVTNTSTLDETITGVKTFSNKNNLEEVEQTVIYTKAEGIEQGNTPADTIYTSLIKAIDKLGQRLGVVEISQNTDGSISNSLGATNSSGEHSSITVTIKEDGTKEALVAATPSNSANGNQIATAAWVKNILKTSGVGLATISKTQSGYCQFTNGLIINWGYVSEAGTDTTITFKKAFSSASSYAVVPTIASGTAYGYPSYVKARTASNFVVRRNDSNKPAHLYIAIGY